MVVYGGLLMKTATIQDNPTNIPYFDYRYLWSSDQKGLRPIIEEICAKGAFILQREVEEFENNLSKFSGSKYALGVADGTVAITMALIASGLNAGDEVIFCSHTFIATAAAIHHAGGVPVPVECREDHLIDPESIKRAITKRTKAIVPTQLNGRVCDMDALMQIAEDNNLFIVEDAAQALGAKYKGRCAGTFGRAGTISFYPAKSLGCFGDGGAILTNDENIYKKIRLLRDHGRDTNGEVLTWGFNSRLDNLQAAILNYKLKSFPEVIERRRALAHLYNSLLSDIADLKLPPLPTNGTDHFDTFQNYEIECDRRDDLKKFLADRGVGTLIQWSGWPVHQFRKLGFNSDLPFTDKLFKRCLMLPMNLSLSDNDIKYISEVIREFYT